MMEHDVIYLQTDEAAESLGLEGVTWCQDKINDGDTKYLLATPEREAAPELLEALERCRRTIKVMFEIAPNYHLEGALKEVNAAIALAAPPDDGADVTQEKE